MRQYGQEGGSTATQMYSKCTSMLGNMILMYNKVEVNIMRSTRGNGVYMI
ncbi:hypothetical protein DOY81_013166 [Sarcophaga bullata]|nr:hypothetical protein DOY81_013166 [Sarcophaga bullata]